MKHLRPTLLILLALSAQAIWAQKVIELPISNPSITDTEKSTMHGGNKVITGVVKPAIEVYLPKADKANGCAVILCPGGALRSLVWSTDVEQMARFLNEKGIAAIGLKYRLNSTRFPQGMTMLPTVDVTGFDRFPQADANPLHYPAGDSIFQLAANDAQEAVKMVRHHAKEWRIDENKIGFLGFSAGGGVAIAATLMADEESEKPNFLCTNYGPALMKAEVTAQAPPLLIMTRVDHPNVSAGLLALFLEWKKAGANAELHMYSDGKGPYTLMPETGHTTTEGWSHQFLLWLKAKGFID